MRQVVLDTETTGLDPKQGHRIIEIGCLEIVNRRLTERQFHVYINPEREIDEGAIKVHGITNESLVDKPLFHEIAQDFVHFIEGAELVIHNAPFDVGFLNAELAMLADELPRIESLCQVTDTLVMARKAYPGQRNSLDALCKRLEVDIRSRQLHGALLDAGLLAEVYLRMTGGQTTLSLDANQHTSERAAAERAHICLADYVATPLVASVPTAEEMTAHEAFLQQIQAQAEAGCLWLETEAAAED